MSANKITRDVICNAGAGAAAGMLNSVLLNLCCFLHFSFQAPHFMLFYFDSYVPLF